MGFRSRCPRRACHRDDAAINAACVDHLQKDAHRTFRSQSAPAGSARRQRAGGVSGIRETLPLRMYERSRAPCTVRSESLGPNRTPRPPPPPPSAWSYGFGRIEKEKVQGFVPLPYFGEGAWQGSANYPDGKLGWVKLTSKGGHAGNDLQHAAIRRWTGPAGGKIYISGSLEHTHKEGDGIRASVVSSRHGVLGQWMLHNTKTKAEFERLVVQKGDTIDFVVDIRGGLNNDDFLWAPIIKAEIDASAKYDKTSWEAEKEFAGPPETPPTPLKPWESLAQALLMANEFVFVD